MAGRKPTWQTLSGAQSAYVSVTLEKVIIKNKEHNKLQINSLRKG